MPTKPPAKKGAPRKRAKPAADASAEAAGEAAPAEPAPKSTPKRAPDAPKVQKTRVLVPTDLYNAHKDELKAPLKEQQMKWSFLGEGKGLYKRPDAGVHCFVQFKDDGVHYDVWGSDEAARDGILAAWRGILGEEAWRAATAGGVASVAADQKKEESEALRLWRLAEPQPRAGEPEFFFKKRMAEWQAKKPAE